MKPRTKRFVFIGTALIAVLSAAALANRAMQGNLSYFRSPTEVVANDHPEGTFRIGGMVKEDSLVRSNSSLDVSFTVTDYAQEVMVTYTGILPDLFSEGTGAVAKGSMGPDGIFYAKEVLAKHDAKYMPPEVQDSLKQAAKKSSMNQDSNGSSL